MTVFILYFMSMEWHSENPLWIVRFLALCFFLGLLFRFLGSINQPSGDRFVVQHQIIQNFLVAFGIKLHQGIYKNYPKLVTRAVQDANWIGIIFRILKGLYDIFCRHDDISVGIT